MKDYRIFVGAFPTGELAARIQAVRARFDPKTAAITPPHVTLAGTYWRSGPATPENEAATIQTLRELDRQIPAFDLRLGGIRQFSPDNPVIFLAVETTPELLSARAALLARLGRDKHAVFVPHLTLAMRLSSRQTAEMAAELQRTVWHTGSFAAPLRLLRLMQRGPADPAWRCIAEIPLADR